MITSLYRLSNDKETQGFGAEGVRDALNLALGALISTVERHGGDVLRIAGDALIVLFHQVMMNVYLLPSPGAWFSFFVSSRFFFSKCCFVVLCFLFSFLSLRPVFFFSLFLSF